jgi:hypothetical protein
MESRCLYVDQYRISIGDDHDAADTNGQGGGGGGGDDADGSDTLLTGCSYNRQ